MANFEIIREQNTQGVPNLGIFFLNIFDEMALPEN